MAEREGAGTARERAAGCEACDALPVRPHLCVSLAPVPRREL